MDNFMQYGIIAFIVALTLMFLQKQSKKTPVVNEQGNPVLRLPKLYGIIGIIASVLGDFILIFAILFFDEEDIIHQVILFLLFAGCGIPLMLQGFRHEVVLTDEGIVVKNMIGKVKSVRWENITTARFNSLTLELKISDGTTTVKCHHHLVGFDLLVDRIVERSGLRRVEMRVP